MGEDLQVDKCVRASENVQRSFCLAGMRCLFLTLLTDRLNRELAFIAYDSISFPVILVNRVGRAKTSRDRPASLFENTYKYLSTNLNQLAKSMDLFFAPAKKSYGKRLLHSAIHPPLIV